MRRKTCAQRWWPAAVSSVLLSVVACGAPTPSASASASTQRGVIVDSAWARAADSGATGAAYLTVRNHDTMAVTVVRVTSAAAASASIHETMQMSGMSHMQSRDSMVIARDSTLRMTTGGVHVMLTDLTRALHAGDTIALTLSLRDGRDVPVRVPVRPLVP